MSHPPSDSPEGEPGRPDPDRPDPGHGNPPPPGPPPPPPPGPAYDYRYPPSYGGQQPYGSQQPWGQQAYGRPPHGGQPPWGGPYAPGTVPGGYGYQAPPTSNRATLAIILGAVSLMACLGFVTGIPAIFVGLSARREIRESQGRLSGDTVALGGIIAGAAGTVLSVLAIAFFVLMVVLGASFDGDGDDDFAITTSAQVPPTTR